MQHGLEAGALRRHPSARQALAEQGFAAECDFLYCPLDVTRKGFGYILLNSLSLDATRFQEGFRNRDASWLTGRPTTVALDVVVAMGENRHGLHAIERYRNSPVMHNIVPDKFKPIILFGGRRVSFPEPTERLEAPSKLPRSVWKAWSTEKTRPTLRSRICSSSRLSLSAWTDGPSASALF